MLAITGDGRRAALDVRLAGYPAVQPNKAEAVAAQVAAIYHDHAQDVFADPFTGQPSDRRGALQLIFCDISTPKKAGEWSVYGEIRAQLVALGVPDAAVRYMHDAPTDRAKAELFAACRDGRVAVLLGSTEKMGVGTNVQDRAVALHHVDCPWRPADIEQREGRIIRQGNQNHQVRILRYATEASFDVYMWQTVQRKSEFIGQVTTGKVSAREIDDVSDATLSYAEVKALATGNPLVLEQAGLQADIAKLARLQEAHALDQHRLVLRHADEANRADRYGNLAEQCQQAIDQRVETRGDAFQAVVAGTAYSERALAGEALQNELRRRLHTVGQDSSAPILELGGFQWEAVIHRGVDSSATVAVPGLPIQTTLNRAEIHGTITGTVAARRLEIPLHGLDREHQRALSVRDRALDDARQASTRIGVPFEHAERLDQLRRRAIEIEAQLAPPDARDVTNEAGEPASPATSTAQTGPLVAGDPTTPPPLAPTGSPDRAVPAAAGSDRARAPVDGFAVHRRSPARRSDPHRDTHDGVNPRTHQHQPDQETGPAR